MYRVCVRIARAYELVRGSLGFSGYARIRVTTFYDLSARTHRRTHSPTYEPKDPKERAENDPQDTPKTAGQKAN